MANIRKYKQKIKKITSNSTSDNDYNNNDFHDFFGTLQKLGTNAVIEGKVSRKCRYVNRQINSKVGMTRW